MVARLVAVAMTVGVLVPVTWSASTTFAPAQAATSSTTTTAASTTVSKAKKKPVRVTATGTLRLAKAQKGKPYRRGADGPKAFDCSGLVKYVMQKQNKKLPHNAQAQYRKAKKIPKSQIKVGDLVFLSRGGHVYHVGIYAGHHKMWHAPKPGSKVKLATIWTKHWKAGRISA
jgi:cell wall-associated NlpC family hydrolase